MIEWINHNQGVVMAALTAAYVITTIFILLMTYISVKEIRLTRELEFRPYVYADFILDFEQTLFLFTIQNHGNSPAKNVRLFINPPLNNSVHPQHSLSEKAFIKNGISTLVPKKEIRTIIGSFGDFNSNFNQEYTIKLTYSDITQTKNYTEKITASFKDFDKVYPAYPKSIHSLVKGINQHNTLLKRIRNLTTKNEHKSN